MARAVLRCPAVAAASASVRDVVAAKRPVVLRGFVDGATVAAALRAVAAAGPTPVLAPRARENTVSGERNRWFHGEDAAALLAGARGQARLDAPDALLRALPAAVDANESAIFVTSAGLRTPLHSDPAPSLLVHCSGNKRVVLVPPDQSDADADRLDRLLALRRASGTLEGLYLGPPRAAAPHAAALAAVDVLLADLDVGDALFVPSRWLHDVESATATVSLAARLPVPKRRRRKRR